MSDNGEPTTPKLDGISDFLTASALINQVHPRSFALRILCTILMRTTIEVPSHGLIKSRSAGNTSHLSSPALRALHYKAGTGLGGSDLAGTTC